MLIFVGIALAGAGLAVVAHVGMNPVMAVTGMALFIAGAVLVALGSRTKEFVGFDVRPVQRIATGEKRADDHG